MYIWKRPSVCCERMRAFVCVCVCVIICVSVCYNLHGVWREERGAFFFFQTRKKKWKIKKSKKISKLISKMNHFCILNVKLFFFGN